MPADLTRIPPFYHKYIGLVMETDLSTAFLTHQKSLVGLLKNLSDDKWNFRYGPGKWTVKDVVQHIIDAERIFCYRALRFSRKDRTELPGFDENTFAVAADAERRNGSDLVEE